MKPRKLTKDFIIVAISSSFQPGKFEIFHQNKLESKETVAAIIQRVRSMS